MCRVSCVLYGSQLRRKQLHSDTNASNETYLKNTRKKKTKHFILEKMKKKRKNKRNQKKKKEKKTRQEKKEGPKRTSRDG